MRLGFKAQMGLEVPCSSLASFRATYNVLEDVDITYCHEGDINIQRRRGENTMFFPLMAILEGGVRLPVDLLPPNFMVYVPTNSPLIFTECLCEINRTDMREWLISCLPDLNRNSVGKFVWVSGNWFTDELPYAFLLLMWVAHVEPQALVEPEVLVEPKAPVRSAEKAAAESTSSSGTEANQGHNMVTRRTMTISHFVPSACVRVWDKGKGSRVAQSLVCDLLLPEDIHVFEDGTDESLGRRLQWHTIVELSEDAEREKALKDVVEVIAKEKTKAAETIEKKAAASEKARALAEKKSMELEARLGEIELKLAEAMSLNTAQAEKLADLKVALKACENKWYNEGFVDMKNSVEPVIEEARKLAFEDGWLAAL
ncbi:hypothetical protein SO802_002122 [Lithocarpus litseifolius]|uniref:Uncharacterized protein n=1 Tax=Lithocarpus litseifolius TaxID=425828 RepID=A0AAW2DZX1_9ROSI